ncbi:acetate CoA-transferase subunit alpha [Escherichia coli]|uniref:Acetate CoA-transferase subunit alpha n=1 Tax=Escherichia coli TaxID=562 RepID=A0A2X1LWF0_ECOLX|nr:acetate CoA-transferase subunit alpha [Escherichia coli]
MKTKLMTLQDATGFFRDGMTIMVGRIYGDWHSIPPG